MVDLIVLDGGVLSVAIEDANSSMELHWQVVKMVVEHLVARSELTGCRVDDVNVTKLQAVARNVSKDIAFYGVQL